MSRPLGKRIYHHTVKPVLNFITFSSLRHRKRQEKINAGLVVYDDSIIRQLEEGITKDNVVYIFQHQMFTTDGTECFNGGAERYVVDLADVLVKKGLNPILIQMGDKKTGLWTKQVKNLQIYGIPVKDMWEYNALVRYFKNYKFVIYSGATPIWGKKIHPNIMISHGVTWDAHGMDCNTAELFNMIADVDTFVSVDTNTISWFKTTFSKTLKDFNAYYVPNYVDTTVYKPASKKLDDKIHIAFPRRAAPERGYWMVSAALKTILDKYPDVVFDFVGYAHGEDVRNDMKKWQEKYPGRVTHCMVQPDEMPKIYQGADISLIPTLYCEGTSLSCLEAQASGNVVISTFIGGLPNLIIDGYNGILISPTGDALIHGLERVLSDKKLYKSLSVNAVSVAQAFDKHVWNNRWAQIVDTLDK